MKVHIYGNVAQEPEIITFYGGEPHVKNVPDLFLREAIIDARVTCSDDFMKLMVLTDAMRRQGAREIHLFIPYFPGARQDRALRGEALTAKVYADIINAQKYDSVTIVDPHSDVVPALVERCHVVPMAEAAKDFFVKTDDEEDDVTGLICPDAGAEKRTYALAKAIGCTQIRYARKHRDMDTGELSGAIIECLPRGRWVIVDDICDGGRTFIGIAEALAEEQSQHDSLELWVTHGIFSNGTDQLRRVFNRIGTTDSLSGEGSEGNLHRYSLEATVLPDIKRRLGWTN